MPKSRSKVDFVEITYPICLNFVYMFTVTQIHFQSSVVFIRGLSEDTTEDGLCNYLENTRRSGGGPVQEVKITGNTARVKFESSRGNFTFRFLQMTGK